MLVNSVRSTAVSLRFDGLELELVGIAPVALAADLGHELRPPFSARATHRGNVRRPCHTRSTSVAYSSELRVRNGRVGIADFRVSRKGLELLWLNDVLQRMAVRVVAVVLFAFRYPLAVVSWIS